MRIPDLKNQFLERKQIFWLLQIASWSDVVPLLPLARIYRVAHNIYFVAEITNLITMHLDLILDIIQKKYIWTQLIL